MNIRTCLTSIAAAALLVLLSPAEAATELLDQVVAIVDDDVIMASELRERIGVVTENLEARGVELPTEDVLVRETLDRLILENIQLQMGARVGVRISDAQLNAAVQRIAAGNGMNLEQFQSALEQEGQSYAAMRDQIRREMVLQRVQSGNVNQRVQITPQEVENFLATEEGQKLAQPQYRILHALLAVPNDASDAEESAADAHVQALLRRIRGGQPFDEVIASSDGRYRFTGGDLGWRSKDDLPSLLSDAAPPLARGETSDPIRSDSGIHLIYMADKRGNSQMVSQTHVRHILIKSSEIMTDQQARQLVGDLKARAEAGTDFGELAKEYSEDIGSAQEGGDLGWTSPGQMVPEFEAMMKKTPVGSISAPVKSQFGWHVIEVLDRREQDMTEEAIQNKAMEYLHQRKYQEELDAWLQRIRDEAYVDIK